MRTTIDIPDAVYAQLKSKAAREDSTVKALVLRGIEQVLSADSMKLPVIGGKKRTTRFEFTNDNIGELLFP